MNAIAGGGSFVSLPAMMHAGLPSTVANASSTIGLFPGSVTSLAAFGPRSLKRLPHASLPVLFGVSLAGGLAGALLLLVTPSKAFDLILPWLLLAATAALLLGKRLEALSGGGGAPAAVLLPLQFALGLYGGYFGGAVGLMTMAAWLALEGIDLKAYTPTRIAMVTAMNAVAVVVFLVAGAWRWRETLALLVGAVAGGWAGAALTKVLPATGVRWAVRIFAVGVTAAYFWKAYG
ncbi:MAG: TSUP family transporter [Caulobacteraceae bacterium]|nr:TSUP family transporter [Caulobacter sp.]